MGLLPVARSGNMGKFSLWLGNFETKEEYDRYLAEHFGHSGPISKFARDLGVTFYDHAHIQSSFRKGGELVPARRALLSSPHSASFIDQAVAAAEAAGEGDVNATLMMLDHAWEPEPTKRVKKFAGGKFRFIGVFDYDSKAANMLPPRQPIPSR